MFFGQKNRKNAGTNDALHRRLAIAGPLDEPLDDGLYRSIILWVVGLFVAAIFWAAVTPVHESVTAEGLVLPLDGARPAQHLEGGVVTKVLVRDGDTVTKGQVLAHISIEETLAALAGLETRRDVLAAEASRQRAILQGDQLPSATSGPWADQFALLTIQDRVAQAETTMLLSQVELAKGQVLANSEELAALKRQSVLAQASLDRIRDLAAKGNASTAAVENADRELSEVMQEMAEARGEAIAAQLQLQQAELSLVHRTSEREEAAANRLAIINGELTSIEKEIAQLKPRIGREKIVAPVSGRIQNLSIANPGEVVAAGAVIATIVPVNREMFAELRVPADRIGEINPGLTAVVKILTFDFARFGGIPAEVAHVSPTSNVDEQGVARYSVRLRLRDAGGLNASALPLRPGMSVSAELRTGSKTVLQYFLKPLRVLQDRALSET